MKKVLFVATVVKTHIMEFHIPYLQMFKEMGWDTAVASRNDYENPVDCKIPFCDHYFDVPFGRNPLKLDNIQAYKQLKRIVEKGNYDIIHCHTPVGAALTRIAASKSRKKGTKIIYTAHGFHFYTGSPALNWMLYYPVEKWLAKYTDVLITINKEDYIRAKTKFSAGKIEYVPGVGIDTSKFTPSAINNEIRKEVLREFNIPDNATVLLSVGEVNKNKNHRIVIEALPRLSNCWYVICGRGPLIKEYQQLAKNLSVENRLVLAGYRTDVDRFYRAADVFVFPSWREGLPVSVMEAMASGLPVACTKIRGSADLVKDGINGFYFKPNDRNSVVDAIERILRNYKSIADVNVVKSEEFEIEKIKSIMWKIYQQA